MTAGDIYTVAGGGTSLEDGATPTAAEFHFGDQLSAAPVAGVIVADTPTGRIREIAP